MKKIIGFAVAAVMALGCQTIQGKLDEKLAKVPGAEKLKKAKECKDKGGTMVKDVCEVNTAH